MSKCPIALSSHSRGQTRSAQGTQTAPQGKEGTVAAGCCRQASLWVAGSCWLWRMGRPPVMEAHLAGCSVQNAARQATGEGLRRSSVRWTHKWMLQGRGRSVRTLPPVRTAKAVRTAVQTLFPQ